MANIRQKQVRVTRSGLFIRQEPNVGYFVYSPYSGLFFAVQDSGSETVLKWLEKKKSFLPPDEYIKALGPGWAIRMEHADYPVQHLLPSNVIWPIIRPQSPILVNWLITGNCPLDCQYCFAQDLMHGRCKEPEKNKIKQIAFNILSHNPLAVVLTGGDPLFSPHLSLAMGYLHKKTGLIVDTCGYTFTTAHLELFKKYNVFVRVSLDSQQPKINDKLRPLNKKLGAIRNDSMGTAEAALNTISKCVEAGVKVGVQTVVTKMNLSDLEALGDKLYRLGVSNWRIMMLASFNERSKESLKLRMDERGQKRFYNTITKHLRAKHRNWWHQSMAIQLTHNRTPNAVVLVSPEGNFCTESNVRLGKELLSLKPNNAAIFDKVNFHAHAERYLNLQIY